MGNIMTNNFKTHKIYANYPMDALHLQEMESDINNLDVNLGDLVEVDCAERGDWSEDDYAAAYRMMDTINHVIETIMQSKQFCTDAE